VHKDLLGHAFVFDEGDEAHRPRAPSAGQNVDGEHPFEQLDPIEPASSLGLIGAIVVSDGLAR